MYKEYFGLKEEPFSIAPDPLFLYMSERHREALAHLLYAIRTDSGFVLLTGEVGTGKTTICRTLLNQIPDDAEVAFILNPKLSVVELLATICDELGVEYPEGNTSIKVFVDRLNLFLLAAHSHGKKTVLIIDEAQNLSSDVLEQIRLLTNLETDKRKLLQVMMLGQPELNRMLDQPELRQLSQRITARYHLEPLSAQELDRYLQYRLSIAGVERPLFPRAVVKTLYRLSNGVPRVINLICDRALLGAYVHGESVVSGKILKQAAAEIFGKRSDSPSRPARFSPGQMLLAVALVMVVAGGFAIFYPQRQTGELPVVENPSQPRGSEAGEVLASEATEPSQPRGSEAGEVLAGEATEPSQPGEETVVVAPLPEVETPSPAALNWSLDIPGGQSRDLAYHTLLALWGYPAGEGDPAGAATEMFNLNLLEERGSLARLRQFDHPAVLRLNAPQGGDFHVTLTGLDDETATLVVGTDVVRVNLTVLLKQWFGDYGLLWRRPPGYQGILRAGSSGVTVLWLEQVLAEQLEREARLEPGLVFDDVLTGDVRTFQSRQGLSPDGLVGPYTLILLNSLLDEDQPRLISQPR